MAQQQKSRVPTVQVDASHSLVEEVLRETKLKPSEEGYDVARRGVEALIEELLSPARKQTRVHLAVVNEMIAEIDRKLSAQVDAILHAGKSPKDAIRDIMDRPLKREQ